MEITPDRTKDCFKSLAELLVAWLDRHETEWEANGYDHETQIKKLRNKLNPKAEGGEV